MDFAATIDASRNLVRVRFAGAVTAPAMEAAAARLEALLPAMKPGFTTFTDFGGVESMDLDCVPHLTRIMDLCRTHGIGLVVRLLPAPDKDLGIKLLSIVHYRGKVKMVTVETLAEAERVLA